MVEKVINNERSERLFDALLKVAADEALQEEMEALPSREELDKIFPRTESFDKRMYGIIKGEFRATRRKAAIYKFTKIAAVFCMVALVCMGALMSVSASRNFILNTIIDIRRDYVALDFGIQGRPHPSRNTIVLGYKPEGFELENSIEMYTSSVYIFMDDADNMMVITRLIGGQFAVSVDNEYLDFSVIQLGSNIAYLFTPIYEDMEGVIAWISGEDVITITAPLDSDTLVKIAENLIVK